MDKLSKELQEEVRKLAKELKCTPAEVIRLALGLLKVQRDTEKKAKRMTEQ